LLKFPPETPPGHIEYVIFRRLHLALFFTLIGLGVAPLHGASPPSVSGVVRNSAGVPQIGAVVQLLRPDLSVVASVYTNSKGRFAFSTVSPGHYAVKAMGTSFLPSLRENVRVQAGTVVNLTLSTLYEVMQWLPAQPRSADARKDDWAWTLRSAANRPLLRWLEDGPLVVVSDGRSRPKLKARLLANGRAGTFGEDGQRIAMEIEDTPSDSRELLARVDFAPGTDASMESMLGFRQELGFAGSVQSLAAISIHPEVEGAGAEGLDEATMRTWESMNMGDEFQAEAGAQQVVARFAQDSPNTIAAVLPFVSVSWRKGDSTVSYRLATSVPASQGLAETQAGAWLPAVTIRDGRLAIERGLHQEVAWERNTESSGMSVLFYSDTLNNPFIEGMAGRPTPISPDVLYDGSSGLFRASAPGYSSTGVVATVERRLPRGNHVRLSYANGDALVLSASEHPTPLNQLISTAHPHRAQMYALSLSGTLDGTGTRWRASYRWQPEDTVTRIAPYAADADEPYLNLHLRQPVFARRHSTRNLDAMIDLRNMLAQGQHPFVLTDGSLLLFAQEQRGITAGLAFTF
jgi:hypothetical protein